VAEAKRIVVASVKLVAARLGNTPAVARASYIHPAIIEAYLDGELTGRTVPSAGAEEGGLRPEERQLERFLAALPAG
jgi:DNA topoisomerase-1